MTVKSVRRYDRGDLNKPKKLDNGWLQAEGYISRSGFLEYKRADGSAWVEYRPDEEAFGADSVASFDSVPLTNNHPSSGLLDAGNTREFQVGTVSAPTRDGDKVRARILVTDAGAIQDLQAGKAELSCGYVCDLEFTPGEANGRRYDAVQRNVRGNHVALVQHGRAGPDVRVRMDTSDMEVVPSPAETKTMTIKIKLDGVEYEVANESAAQAITKQVETLKNQAEKATARADAADAENAKLKVELKEAPAKASAAAKARAELEVKARKVLGSEAKFDGQSDAQVRVAVAEKAHGLKMDGKSEGYVEAMFDLAVVKQDEAPADEIPSAPLDETAPVSRADSLEKLHEAFLARSRNAHRTKEN